jgi:hypothetical protein
MGVKAAHHSGGSVAVNAVGPPVSLQAKRPVWIGNLGPRLSASAAGVLRSPFLHAAAV